MSTNVVWSKGNLTRGERWKALGSRGVTLWFTGLSGAGKSTIAAALEAELVHKGISAYRLDGDNIRHGLCSDLGFSPEDRAENIRRIGEVAKLFSDSGTVAIASFISPYISDRQACRELHEKDGLRFLEVFVDAPIDVCEGRDPKGLYKKARNGEIQEFTGISSPYESPTSPDLVLHTDKLTVEECVAECVKIVGNWIR